MATAPVKLAVVIVHYNTSDDLARLLLSLQEHPPHCTHAVVVVDNASSDPGLDAVRQRFPGCEWMMNAENVGYARGCNLGLQRRAAEYALVLNPDIVVQPGALDGLLAFADAHPRAGIVGPQLLNEDGTIQDSCRRFYSLATLLMRRTVLGKLFPRSQVLARHLMRDFDHRSSRPVDWVLGGCLLARRAAVERVGPLDERFFLYFEDVDWCYRMWQGGWEVLYTPDARFIHRHRRASARGLRSRSFWLHLGSLISFYEKWGMLVYLLKKWRGPLSVMLLWSIDMLALTAAFHGAYGLRAAFGGLFAEELYPLGEYRPLFLFSLLLATVTFALMGRYRPARLREPPRVWPHLQQTGALALLLLASSYLGQQQVVSRAVLLGFLVLAAAFTAAGEELFRSLLRRMERGYFTLERTLLVGPRAELAAWLADAPRPRAAGVDPVGWVCGDQPAHATEAPGPPLGDGEIPWLGGWPDLPGLVDRFRASQVVFWESPGADEARRRTLAELRRGRVRLRWQGDVVWLLAAGARPELFCGAPSGVVEPGAGAALAHAALRVASFAAGLLLTALAWPAWLWLRLVRLPRGRARRVGVDVTTRAGHNERVTLAVGASGGVLPLPWQWGLAGALLRGDMDLWGLRPVPVDRPQPGGSVLSWWETWRSDLQRPGLCGPWLLAERSGRCDAGTPDVSAGAGWLRRAAAVVVALWNRPGGWERLPASSDITPPFPVGAEGDR
ncbi:MAG: glycosyltransferase [Candidatus Krumholzibacteriia bacterium]